MCDAYNYTIVSVLAQRVHIIFHFIYYIFRILDFTKSNYTTTKKEFLEIMFALNKFSSYLLDYKVVSFPYHATLMFLYKSRVKNLVPNYHLRHNIEK